MSERSQNVNDVRYYKTESCVRLAAVAGRRTRQCSRAGYSSGWLWSTPEGRRPQIRGLRAGGSLALASSTPATQPESRDYPRFRGAGEWVVPSARIRRRCQQHLCQRAGSFCLFEHPRGADLAREFAVCLFSYWVPNSRICHDFCPRPGRFVAWNRCLLDNLPTNHIAHTYSISTHNSMRCKHFCPRLGAFCFFEFGVF